MTYLIIIVTAYISYQAFQDKSITGKYIFNAYRITRYNEWYRLLSHGLLHADWNHLIFNMVSLLFFGPIVEAQFGRLVFLAMYTVALAFSSLLDLYNHKDDSWYNALGASGAVSAVIFTAIFLDPWQQILIYFIPLPGIIFGIGYLFYSNYMGRRKTDNIGHDAHFMGAVFGFLFPVFISLDYLQNFIHLLLRY